MKRYLDPTVDREIICEVKKEDHYQRIFTGSEYDLGQPSTVAELKSRLEAIIRDLPTKPGLEISDFQMQGTSMYYILREGLWE